MHTTSAKKEPARPSDAESGKKAGTPACGSYLRESDLMPEEAFRELLGFERKRSERSRKTLAMMLLDASNIVDRADRYAVIGHAVRALASSAGALVCGWYKQDMVLGAIVVGAETGCEELRDRISGDIPKQIRARTGKLKLVFCYFPPDHGRNNGNHHSESIFYQCSGEKEKKQRWSSLMKRAMDIAGGSAGMLLFSPLFIVFSLLIKATSKGPVFFRQERIGRSGQKFVFFKFRTMSADNDPKIHQDYIRKFIQEKKSYAAGRKGAIYKIKDDPRVTPVGRFLRKTSLDELPQFINVLKGDMSLVGPRPPVPYELENYELWHKRRIMEIKPGLTGLWQVSGRSSTTFDEMVRLDLKYAREWSLWLDIKIILKTPWVVLTGKGGY